MMLAITNVAMAGYRETFEQEFLSKPWGGETAEADVCIGCHASEKIDPKYKDIPQKWEMSIHYLHNVSCHDCHGGDPKDASLSMSPQRGFVGAPKYRDVPEFCGKCHVGILKNYLESGHGKALRSTGKGPNCVTCHGSHKEEQYIQKANIDIINEGLCSRCHSYERAKIMKQALFLTEKKIGEIDRSLEELRREGIYAADDEKALFSTEAEFRTLFHTVDVNLVKDRTDEFTKRLNAIERNVRNTFNEVKFRRNFSSFLMLVFAGLAILVAMLSATYKE
jgi:nitrate/TMAO reductase-like tetraheme cytochrome c subunit